MISVRAGGIHEMPKQEVKPQLEVLQEAWICNRVFERSSPPCFIVGATLWWGESGEAVAHR